MPLVMVLNIEAGKTPTGAVSGNWTEHLVKEADTLVANASEVLERFYLLPSLPLALAIGAGTWWIATSVAERLGGFLPPFKTPLKSPFVQRGGATFNELSAATRHEKL